MGDNFVFLGLPSGGMAGLQWMAQPVWMHDGAYIRGVLKARCTASTTTCNPASSTGFKARAGQHLGVLGR